MANRHLFRTIVVQVLFQWDMRGYANAEIPGYMTYTLHAFNDVPFDNESEILELTQEVAKKRSIIDEIIEKAAPDWPLPKITITDRNILRLGIYELLFGDHQTVPPKVAINEAIELGKQFGGPKTGKFINGVIGAVYREIGEPGKDDVTKKKMDEVPYEEMPIEQKGSAVVYSIDENGVIRLGMVHDVFGYWTLSKGGIEEGETSEEGTIRELKEETNWDITIQQKIGENEYIAYPPEKGPTRKQVTYYLAKAPYAPPVLTQDSGGLDDVRWFELSEVGDLNIYDDVSQMIIKSIGIITDADVDDESEMNPQVDQPAIDATTLSLVELKELAKERGFTGYSSLKKTELIALLSQ